MKIKSKEVNIKLLKLQIYNEIKLEMLQELTKYRLEIRNISVMWSPYKHLGIFLNDLKIDQICYQEYNFNSTVNEIKREEAVKELLKRIDKKEIIKISKKQDIINKIKLECDKKINEVIDKQ